MRKAILTAFTFPIGIFLFIFHVLFIAIVSPIFLYRFLLSQLSSSINPSLGKMVSSRGQFLAGENYTSTKSPRANIVLCAVVQGQQSLSAVKEIVIKNVINAKLSSDKLKYPELTQYVTTWPKYLGFHFWKPEVNFNIDDHILPHHPNPSSPFTDDDLRDFIEKLINEPFESGKSPWKILLTNNFVDSRISREPMALLTIKCHHCLSDGFGLLHLMVEHLGGGMPSYPKANHKKSSISEMLMFPFRAIHELSRFSTISLQPHPWKISDESKSWKQLYWKSQIIPIQKIKDIKKRFGVSFSSVVASAYTSACQKSLLAKCGNVDDALHSAFILPLPDHPKILRNYCTGVFITAPTKICHPLERLRECDNEINSAKSSVLPILGKYLPALGGSLTTGLSSILGRNRQLSVGISNFAIGSVQYEVMERKLLHVFAGAGAQVGVAGLTFLVYTYMNGIQFTATAESALMSHDEIRQFIQYVEDEIGLLHELSTN